MPIERPPLRTQPFDCHASIFPAQVLIAKRRPNTRKHDSGITTLVSSISVYRDFSEAGLDENASTAILPPGADDSGNNGQHYGANKAMCERTAERAMPGRVLIVRPGIIVGPHDLTNRFSHWVLRIARGGDILCPAPPEAPLTNHGRKRVWPAQESIRMTREPRRSICFQRHGPAHALTAPAGSWILVKDCSGSDARFVWADEEFLLEHKINPSTELPLWIPKMETSYAGFFTIDCQRALKAGLAFRPLAETVLDVFAFALDSSNNAREKMTSSGLTGSKAFAGLGTPRISRMRAPAPSMFRHARQGDSQPSSLKLGRRQFRKNYAATPEELADWPTQL